jgi:hypothetical protein
MTILPDGAPAQRGWGPAGDSGSAPSSGMGDAPSDGGVVSCGRCAAAPWAACGAGTLSTHRSGAGDRAEQ